MSLWLFLVLVLVISTVWLFVICWKEACREDRAAALSGQSAARRLRARGETR